MSDFTEFSLGETLKMKEIKNWKTSAPLTLFNKWIGVNNRYNGYIEDYCLQNATLNKAPPHDLCKYPANAIATPITTKKIISYIQKQLRILLTRFALLNRSGNSTHKTYLDVNINVVVQDGAAGK